MEVLEQLDAAIKVSTLNDGLELIAKEINKLRTAEERIAAVENVSEYLKDKTK